MWALHGAACVRLAAQKMATAEEVDKLATPEMVQEFISKKRRELEDLCIFNVAADEIWAAEQLAIEDKDVQEEVDVRKKQYEVRALRFSIRSSLSWWRRGICGVAWCVTRGGGYSVLFVLRSCCARALQAQQLEYDEQAIREQVIDTFKHLRVVEWLKDNLKRNVVPWKSA